jgi:hypothetical protein
VFEPRTAHRMVEPKRGSSLERFKRLAHAFGPFRVWAHKENGGP